jgi:hypothetical protein
VAEKGRRRRGLKAGLGERLAHELPLLLIRTRFQHLPSTATTSPLFQPKESEGTAKREKTHLKSHPPLARLLPALGARIRRVVDVTFKETDDEFLTGVGEVGAEGVCA